MSSETPNPPPATLKQERNATIFTILAVVLTLVVGSPCICYFGFGLFYGVHQLRSGQDHNPARKPYERKTRKRDRRFDPVFDEDGNLIEPDRTPGESEETSP